MTFIVLHKIDTRAYREDEGDPQHLIPVVIATDSIRCFNPRRNNAPGARITFKDGGGFAVNLTCEQLLAQLGQGDLIEAYRAAHVTSGYPSIGLINEHQN